MLKDLARGGQTLHHSTGQVFTVIGWLICSFVLTYLASFFLWSVLQVNIAELLKLEAYYESGIREALANALAHHQSLAGIDSLIRFLWAMHFDGKAYEVDQLHKQLSSDVDLETILYILKWGLWLALTLSLLVTTTLGYFLITRGKKNQTEHKLRGNGLVSNKALKQAVLAQNKQVSSFTINEIPLPFETENQHFLYQGTVRVGKSNAMRQLMMQVRQLKHRAVIYDKTGEYVSRFYRPGKDIILNPLDARCPTWSLWQECEKDYHYKAFARALLPDQATQEQFFVKAARIMFEVAAKRLKKSKDTNTIKLLRLLLTSDLSQMTELVQDTEAETLMSDKVEKMALSVKAIFSNHLSCLKYLNDPTPENPGFSIRDWVKDEASDSWVFVTSNGEMHELLKPLITVWLDTFYGALLSLTPSRERRIFIALDELPSLNRLPSLENGLAEGPKFGACFAIGIQDISQFYACYGQNTAESMLGNLNTRSYFRCPDSVSAEKASKGLGEYELEEKVENISYDVQSQRDNVSLSTHKTMRRNVLTSEITDLPKLTAFLKLPGDLPITKVKFKYIDLPEVEPALIEASEKDVDRLLYSNSTTAKPKPSQPQRFQQPFLGQD